MLNGLGDSTPRAEHSPQVVAATVANHISHYLTPSWGQEQR